MARILVVDGNDPVRSLLAHLLRGEGHLVEQATDGRQALAQFDSHPFDLVLMDVYLPSVDGLEACRRLRRHSRVPIMLLSASQDPGLEEQARRCGASSFLHKPVAFGQLQDWVRGMTGFVL